MGLLSRIKTAAQQQSDNLRNSASTSSTTPDAGPSEPVSTSSPFVVAKGGDLYLRGQRFRFASLNAPELLDGDVGGAFEAYHTFATLALPGSFARAVTRSYTLRIKSKNIGRGHINGYNREWGDFEWDEGRFVEMDQMLAEAAKWDVKVVVPIINQDTGEDSNWVGSYLDLIRMRKGFNNNEEAKRVDWWTDHEMIEAFKLVIDKLLNRVNTITGVRYGDDPTILAWETGNELNWNGMRPAPASWTTTIAKHLKSRAPNTLVMDGSFARSENVSACYPPEILKSPDVDIFSYHYYGSGDIPRVKKDCELARKHGKVFIAGEFGFFDKPSDYGTFMSILDTAGGAGSLAWSLRPASSRGGFKTHGEGNGIWSYHIPGWPTAGHREFDAREANIIQLIRQASYKINKERIPSHPVPPPASSLWMASPHQLCFASSPWAQSYELILRNRQTGQELGRRQIYDCTKEDEHCVDVQMELGVAPREVLGLRLRGISVDGAFGGDSQELSL